MSDPFDLVLARNAVRSGRVQWRVHALERLAQRQLSTDQIKNVILSGEVIEDYPATTPYPSALLYGVVAGRPVHVVVGLDAQGAGTVYVITTYEPDERHFEADLKTRKRRPHE